MRITEVFHSIQGEARFAGVPTLFIRTTGCHLRCTWCDSEYAFHGGETRTVGDLLDHADDVGAAMVCLTGGEPLLQKDAKELVEGLLDRGHRVIIETSGSLDLEPWTALGPRERLCLSVDVKLPGSGMEEHNRLEELARLGEHDQVKFVIKDDTDYQYAVKVLGHVPDDVPVYFQPVWGEDPKWLTERVLEEGLPVNVSLQLHKYIWGDVPGV